jgi:hypothetical protein
LDIPIAFARGSGLALTIGLASPNIQIEPAVREVPHVLTFTVFCWIKQRLLGQEATLWLDYSVLRHSATGL